MSNKHRVLQLLQQLAIPCTVYEHPAVFSMAECLALPFCTPETTFCKNILLCNRQQTAFYLYVTLPDKPFRTAEVSKLLHVSRLSFAPEDSLPRLLGLESGSLSPLGLWFDPSNAVTLVFDSAIRREGQIAFHPCDNTATVVFEQSVFWAQVVPSLSHEAIFI